MRALIRELDMWSDGSITVKAEIISSRAQRASLSSFLQQLVREGGLVEIRRARDRKGRNETR